MKPIHLKRLVAVLASLACLTGQVVAGPVGTAFTYQGRLASGSTASSGQYDFSFTLYDDPSAGVQKGATLTTNGVPVTNGLFAVTLDFGVVFDGNARWLAIGVKTNGAASFTALTPRRSLTPAPYAIWASSLSSNVNQTFVGMVSFSPAGGPPFTVSSAAKVVNLNADMLDGLDSTALWQLGGNAGTTAGVNFMGTTDNQALELKVNAERALRLEPSGTATPNVIGGFRSNLVAAGVSGAAIAGGGGTNQVNTVQASFSNIGGGGGNTVQAVGGYAAYSVIGGGYGNTIQTSANYGTIAGGTANQIQNSTANAAIGGGTGNTIQTAAHQGVIGGGSVNVISPSAYNSVVSGGAFNQAGGAYATVPGGLQNAAAGAYSFAAGRRAKANQQGDFVWADSTDADFAPSAPNQFAVRAHGGVWLQTGSVGVTMDGPLSGATLDASQLTGTIPDARLSANVASAVSAANAATSDNTANTIVKRDFNGNFSAGIITGNQVICKPPSGGYAVEGDSPGDGWPGVYGYASDPRGCGVSGQGGSCGVSGTGDEYGVSGTTFGTGGYGVSGWAYGDQAYGVYGDAYNSSGGCGVFGHGDYGVYGISPTGYGVYGYCYEGDAVYGETVEGLAGHFAGNVSISGTLSKSAGSFRIDHPLDPANKYLSHSFVESPDMKNIYDGVTPLDRNGEAVVKLPDWFGALNRDFRYQLTAIGAPGPNLYIAEEIAGNEFKIAGGAAGMKVSWQVTGIRQDSYANAHRILVEEAKAESERGSYLHPELFGQPQEKKIGRLNRSKLPSPPSPRSLQAPPTLNVPTKAPSQ